MWILKTSAEIYFKRTTVGEEILKQRLPLDGWEALKQRDKAGIFHVNPNSLSLNFPQ